MEVGLANSNSVSLGTGRHIIRSDLQINFNFSRLCQKKYFFHYFVGLGNLFSFKFLTSLSFAFDFHSQTLDILRHFLQNQNTILFRYPNADSDAAVVKRWVLTMSRSQTRTQPMNFKGNFIFRAQWVFDYNEDYAHTQFLLFILSSMVSW